MKNSMPKSGYLYIFQDPAEIVWCESEPTPFDRGCTGDGSLAIIRLSDGHYYYGARKWRPIAEGILSPGMHADGIRVPAQHGCPEEEERKPEKSEVKK